MGNMLIVAFALAATFQPEMGSAPQPASRDSTQMADSRSIQAAREFLMASHFGANMRLMAHHIAQASMGAILESSERQRQIDFPDDLEAELRLILANYVEEFADAIEESSLGEAAEVYSRHFSVEELQELRRLQELPVMAKLQGLLPQLTAELADIGTDAARERQAELEQEVTEAIEAWLARQPDAATPAT